LESQRYACAVCERSFAEVVAHVDHDHTTGRVRGVLCSACNTALGLLKEDETRMAALISYIRKHSQF